MSECVWERVRWIYTRRESESESNVVREISNWWRIPVPLLWSGGQVNYLVKSYYKPLKLPSSIQSNVIKVLPFTTVRGLLRIYSYEGCGYRVGLVRSLQGQDLCRNMLSVVEEVPHLYKLG